MGALEESRQPHAHLPNDGRDVDRQQLAVTHEDAAVDDQPMDDVPARTIRPAIHQVYGVGTALISPHVIEDSVSDPATLMLIAYGVARSVASGTSIVVVDAPDITFVRR